LLPQALAGKNPRVKTSSRGFRCPEHISAGKALELKADFRDLPCFMPVFWKVTNRGPEGSSTYGVHDKSKHHEMWCQLTSSTLLAGTVTKVLETVRRGGHREKTGAWARARTNETMIQKYDHLNRATTRKLASQRHFTGNRHQGPGVKNHPRGRLLVISVLTSATTDQ
jgi:hypothetical protein